MTGSLDRPTTGLATLARLHLLALKQGVSAAFRRGGEESERVNVMVRWRAGTRIRMRGVRFIAQGTHGCWDRRIEWGDSLSSIRLRTQAFSDACCTRLIVERCLGPRLRDADTGGFIGVEVPGLAAWTFKYFDRRGE